MISESVPAIPFMTQVRNYALENKLPFWTWEEQTLAMQKFINATYKKN